LVEPRYLVLTAFLATGVMSLFTGTSWGSAGTIGVALMGTAAALGAPLAATAGAVVAGAYLGDKMSPLSDSTNICAIGAGAPLFAHIRHMLWTATPSCVLAVAVYALLGGGAATPGEGLPAEATGLLRDIEGVFRLNGWVLLPAAVVVVGIAIRVPPAPAIALSSLVALGVGTTVQPFSLQQVLEAAVTGFRGGMLVAAGSDPQGVGEAFLRLVERGGLHAMAPTLVVVIAAFLLAGAMDVSGALDLIIARLLGTVRGVFGLIGATMGAGATMIALTSHGGVTALVIGELFQPAYRERGLAPENLSRSLEDSVTITEPLMPWTVSAVFMATTLGVPTSQYAPWAVFCWGGPCFSLLVAALWRRTGRGIRQMRQASGEAQEPEGRPQATPAIPLAGTRNE
jgi:NhaC family Na+:H+ antiporter